MKKENLINVVKFWKQVFVARRQILTEAPQWYLTGTTSQEMTSLLTQLPPKSEILPLLSLTSSFQTKAKDSSCLGPYDLRWFPACLIHGPLAGLG